MKINNIESVANKFSCKKRMAKYLIKNGFLPISEENDRYYFSKNSDVMEAFKDAPFYLKIREGGE